MTVFTKKISCLYFALISIHLLSAQEQRVDTLRIYDIPEVIITENEQISNLQKLSPTQSLNAKQLKELGGAQLSDAVKHFAGVTVKDYGGIGGLKTVSLRSLGAEHTVVGYDGIALSDVQTGQVDIGRFSLEDVERVSISNGQEEQLLQPAKFFAASGVLQIRTATPVFTSGKSLNARAGMKVGSFGLLSPSLRLEKQFTPQWAAALSGEWMGADGHYPYLLHYGDKADSTSVEKRKNTQVNNLRLEADLFGHPNSDEEWRVKVYYYRSQRGLPNATTFYYDYSEQQLTDENIFAQLSYRKKFTPRWEVQASAKWNHSQQRYTDPSALNSAGELSNSYLQQEAYLTMGARYRLTPQLSFAINTDGSINSMQTQAKPTRYSWLSVAAVRYINSWVTASASALSTVIHEQVKEGPVAGNHRKLSPFVSLSLRPLQGEELRIRLFYKQHFRLPGFNDLYYASVGNNTLAPENTRQANVGITYSRRINNTLSLVRATVDVYRNNVTNKIVAMPTKDLFQWSMLNLGKVDIKGLDATLGVLLTVAPQWNLDLSGSYTYQEALDVTDPQGKVYKHQIPYTPRLSASGRAALETPWASLSYSLIYAGKRYAQKQNIAVNSMPSYADHSLQLSRCFAFHRIKADVSLEALNLAHKNYEIIRYFPMPGRSFRATLKLIY